VENNSSPVPVQDAFFGVYMNELKLLSPLFYDLIERANKIEALTPELMDEFYAKIGSHESFLPELIAVIGPATFELLVRYYGGESFKIPKADDIIKFVRNPNEGL
jgi:hypothetical protein